MTSERAVTVKTSGVPPGIAGQMIAEGGEVSFARFMELALTHPTEGYYSQADVLLGPRGHFSTAPSLSPEFNQSVARLVEELVTAALKSSAVEEADGGGQAVASAAQVIELGGGAGELAETVLGRLQETDADLKDRMVYAIVEVGERLRQHQRGRVKSLLKSGWRVTWVPTLAAGLKPDAATVVIGNEFVDALPVDLVDVRGDEPLQARVAVAEAEPGDSGRGDGGDEGPAFALREVWGGLAAEAKAELQELFGTTDAAALRERTQDGFIELRSSVRQMFGELAAVRAGACLLTLDYGQWYGAADGSSPYRRTVRGYFRHQLVDDLYARVGRQDLTADVDFRALDLHGGAAGFETVLHSSVGDLLRGDSGLDRLKELREGPPASLDVDRRASILEKLLDDDDLGGAFRLLLQVRG